MRKQKWIALFCSLTMLLSSLAVCVCAAGEPIAVTDSITVYASEEAWNATIDEQAADWNETAHFDLLTKVGSASDATKHAVFGFAYNPFAQNEPEFCFWIAVTGDAIGFDDLGLKIGGKAVVAGDTVTVENKDNLFYRVFLPLNDCAVRGANEKYLSSYAFTLTFDGNTYNADGELVFDDKDLTETRTIIKAFTDQTAVYKEGQTVTDACWANVNGGAMFNRTDRIIRFDVKVDSMGTMTSAQLGDNWARPAEKGTSHTWGANQENIQNYYFVDGATQNPIYEYGIHLVFACVKDAGENEGHLVFAWENNTETFKSAHDGKVTHILLDDVALGSEVSFEFDWRINSDVDDELTITMHVNDGEAIVVETGIAHKNIYRGPVSNVSWSGAFYFGNYTAIPDLTMSNSEITCELVKMGTSAAALKNAVQANKVIPAMPALPEDTEDAISDCVKEQEGALAFEADGTIRSYNTDICSLADLADPALLSVAHPGYALKSFTASFDLDISALQAVDTVRPFGTEPWKESTYDMIWMSFYRDNRIHGLHFCLYNVNAEGDLVLVLSNSTFEGGMATANLGKKVGDGFFRLSIVYGVDGTVDILVDGTSVLTTPWVLNNETAVTGSGNAGLLLNLQGADVNNIDAIFANARMTADYAAKQTQKNDDTQKTVDTGSKTAETKAAPTAEKKSGCSSSFVGFGMTLCAVAACAVVSRKKKEND